MNTKPIEQSTDSDLRGSAKAIQRASLNAREVAKATGTEIVVEIDNELIYLKPDDPADPLTSSGTAA